MRYKDRYFGLKIKNPISESPSPGGLHQYIYPETTEQVGKTVSFLFDHYGEFSLRFKSQSELEFFSGSFSGIQKYDCIKADNDTYLLLVRFFDQQPYKLLTIVWNRLLPEATLVVSTLGKVEKWPKLVESLPYFGTRTDCEIEPTTSRQTFSDDLIGKRIEWMYTPNDAVLHIYTSRNRVRLGKNRYHLIDGASQADIDNYIRHVEGEINYPFYEEPAFFIRLNDHLNLYSVIEYNGYHANPKGGGGELLAVVDTKKVRYIGRTFGPDAENKPLVDIVGAPGTYLNTPDEVERFECPYYHY